MKQIFGFLIVVAGLAPLMFTLYASFALAMHEHNTWAFLWALGLIPSGSFAFGVTKAGTRIAAERV